MKDYQIKILYGDTDQRYIADIPGLGGRSAFGKTPTGVLTQAVVSKRAWLLAARAEMKPIAKPGYCPAIYKPRT